MKSAPNIAFALPEGEDQPDRGPQRHGRPRVAQERSAAPGSPGDPREPVTGCAAQNQSNDEFHRSALPFELGSRHEGRAIGSPRSVGRPSSRARPPRAQA